MLKNRKSTNPNEQLNQKTQVFSTNANLKYGQNNYG